jgi:ferrous iron transport protein A
MTQEGNEKVVNQDIVDPLIHKTIRTTLDRLAPGQQGQVIDVDATSALGCRLLELGIVPGRRAQLLRAAPLGDPIEIRIAHSLLSLRRYEARLVSVSVPA